MTERAVTLASCLRPAHEPDIVRLVHALVPVMKQRNWDEKTSTAILKTYVFDLADQPFFAIQDACTAFRRNLVGDGWMPTPGELLVETKRKSEWVRKEAIEIDRILQAEVVTELPKAERQSVRARVDSLMKGLKAARPANEVARGYTAEVEQEEAPAARLDRIAAEYRDNPVALGSNVGRVFRPRIAA